MRSVFRVFFVILAVLLTVPVNMSRAQQAARVVMVANSNLGDKSFYDSAQRGLQRAHDELGIDFKTIELGPAADKWEPGLDDAMADTQNYDILITGTPQMAGFLAARAGTYPDKKFIIFDTSVDYTQCKCANVYSIQYAQNEGSYLAGVYAAAMLKDGSLPNLSGKGIIGAMGGADIPVINDFIAGYEQGAKSVNPAITVIKQYVGGAAPFGDPAKGKEIGLAMYEQGADIVFHIAAGSGLGVFEAAKEKGKYAIGVDSDQATILKDTDPQEAQHILTSMMKNVDNSLFRALSLDKAGKLPYGQVESMGLAEGAVGLAKNDIYDKLTPNPVKKLVDQAEADIIACKIKVATVLEGGRPCTPATLAATQASQ